MTVSDVGQPSSTADPQASLRAELLGQLVAAQFELEATMAELSGNAIAISECRSQLQALSLLQKHIGGADAKSLSTLRSEIVAAVTQTQTVAQQGRAAVANAAAQASADLAVIAATSRTHVTGIMRDMHGFDPYLDFASDEDEAAYRQRETERRAYIEAQQRQGTPEGDLNAAGAAVGQMADAHAHGAGNSPEFEQRWNDLVASTAQLRDTARANGVSTEEFDRNLRQDLRRILQSKGLSEAEIDARFATNPDPLDAVRAYVSGEQDMVNVEALARNARRAEQQVDESNINTDAASVDLMAEFRAAGIVANEYAAGDALTHGVGQNHSTNGRRQLGQA